MVIPKPFFVNPSCACGVTAGSFTAHAGLRFQERSVYESTALPTELRRLLDWLVSVYQTAASASAVIGLTSRRSSLTKQTVDLRSTGRPSAGPGMRSAIIPVRGGAGGDHRVVFPLRLGGH